MPHLAPGLSEAAADARADRPRPLLTHLQLHALTAVVPAPAAATGRVLVSLTHDLEHDAGPAMQRAWMVVTTTHTPPQRVPMQVQPFLRVL